MSETKENLFTFPILHCSTEGMPVEDWRRLRMNFLGGSDAAPATGMSRYRGPIGVYYDKIQEMPDKAEDNERLRQKFRAGHMLEPVIAAMFAEETGKTVVKQPYFYIHPKYDFIAANIDFAVIEEDGLIVGLECKNSAVRDHWKEGCPDEYYLQCQHYMCVTGAKFWYIAYLLDGWEFNYQYIARDEDVIAELIKAEFTLWYTHILPKIPPAFDGTIDSTNLIRFLYPDEKTGEKVQLGEEAENIWAEQADIASTITQLEKRKTELQNQLKAMIGENEFGETEHSLIKFSTVNVKAKIVEGYSYRRLYRKVKTVAKAQ